MGVQVSQALLSHYVCGGRHIEQTICLYQLQVEIVSLLHVLDHGVHISCTLGTDYGLSFCLGRPSDNLSGSCDRPCQSRRSIRSDSI